MGSNMKLYIVKCMDGEFQLFSAVKNETVVKLKLIYDSGYTYKIGREVEMDFISFSKVKKFKIKQGGDFTIPSW